VGVNSRTDGDYDRLFLYLYDPSGNQVAADENYQPFNQASITYNANTTGVFKVKSYLGLASATRNLSTSSPYLLTPALHNKETTRDIPSGDAVWYDLTVSTPGLVGVNSRTDGDYDRLFLYLYDPSGNQVAADENYQPFNQASITYIANITGVYKVKSYLGRASASRNLSISYSVLRTVNLPQSPVSTTKGIPVPTESTPNPGPIDPPLPPPIIPIAAAAGTTIAVGTVAAFAGGSIMNRFSNFWAKFDEMFIELFREFFKKLFKKLFKKIIQILFGDKLISRIGELSNSYLSETLKLIIGGGILFFAFSIAYSGVANKIKYDISPLIFLVSLAFFSMFSEISQDLGLKFTLKSAGINSVFRLSPIGSLITILSGFSGLVIAAVGSSKSLNKDNNPQINVLAIASGSLLNMLFGLVLLVLSLLLQMNWLAAVGAVPSLASATCGLFPSYPFEGRNIFKDNRFIWGLLFFISLMLYLLARMVFTRG
ncbi:MAG: hypothetical protein Q7J35_00005, partial [Candidatus Methanoperedens sp.]|nr:hypothetical protein [Candidatus Methanoperedens sp.]